MTPTGKGDRTMVLVDLSGSPRNRRVVRTVARQAVRLLAHQAPSVLVHAPSADGKLIQWPAGTRVVESGELIDAGAQKRIQSWVGEVSWRLVHDRALWPEVEGISLGPLQAQLLQESLLSFGQAAEALGRAMELERAQRCLVVAGYGEVAKAFVTEARRGGGRAQVLSLPGRPRFAATRREPHPDALPSLERISREPGVLLVSESRPMAEMFDAVDAALGRTGTGPVVRVEYGRRVPPDARDLIPLDRPEKAPTQPLAISPEARAALVSTRLQLSDQGYAAPVEFLVSGLYQSTLFRQVLHLRKARALLSEIRPRLVVVGNDRWWIGTGYVLAARSLGIPTLSIQDGVAWDTPTWWFSTADRTAVNGAHLAGLLEAHGLAADRISIVGQPRYDGMRAETVAERRPGARRRCGLAESDFAVLFATQPNQDHTYICSIVEAVLAAGEAHLLLRPHPSTGQVARDAVRRLAAQSDRITLASDGDILDHIAAADLVVAQNSTVVLEAAMLGRPVITANFTGLPEIVPYAALGISREATSPLEVTGFIAAGIRGELAADPGDPALRRGVEFLIGPTDGGAAGRVARLIQECILTPDPVDGVIHDDIRS